MPRMAILTTALLQESGIRKGQPLHGVWGVPKIFFINNHRTVQMRPCNPVGATLAIALAA